MKIYILLSFITFLAGFTQGLSGFGSILLALPVLAIFMDIKTVIPLVALHALAMSIILLIQLRKHLEWAKISPLFIGCLPGVPLGVFFLKAVDTGVLQMVLGTILVAYSFFSMRGRFVGRVTGKWAYVFGFLAGCLGGAFSAAGPPVIVYTSLQHWGKDIIKVTLQGFFVASGILVVFMQVYHGLTTSYVWHLFVVSFPALLAGTYIGSFFYGKISDQTYRKVMLLLLALLGIFTIYSALTG